MDTYVLSRASSPDHRVNRVLGVRFSLKDAKTLALEREGGELHGQKWCQVLANAKAPRDPRHWALPIVMEGQVSSLVYRIDKFVVPTTHRESVLDKIMGLSKVNEPVPDVTFTEEDIRALSDNSEV